MLLSQPQRSLMIVIGIALCVVLMLFLLSIYNGVADGSVEYIRRNTTDFWVLQANSTNILRGSSILSTGHGSLLRLIPQVESASPILFLLSSLNLNGQLSTVFLTGYDPATGVGGPPVLADGRGVYNDSEIVLDKSFAAKHHLRVGGVVALREDTLRVVGLSEGTNMFVIQYAFVTLHKAQEQVGFPGLVSCFLVKAKGGLNHASVKAKIAEELPGVEVFDQQEFLRNNVHEMESGFLPLLFVIAVIGAVVLTTILSLILSINILERRKDLAVLKTLGSPQSFLFKLVISQGFFLSTGACVVALVLFAPLTGLVEVLSPEVGIRSSFIHVVLIVLVVWGLGLLSSIIALHRLRKIYPLEAFS